MFEWGSADRTFANCRACADVWLYSVAQQQEAHSEAVSALCARQLDALGALSEARDAAQFPARLLACADPKMLELTALSTRLAGILGETHRKLGDVVGSHAHRAHASRIDDAATAEEPRRNARSPISRGRRRRTTMRGSVGRHAADVQLGTTTELQLNREIIMHNYATLLISTLLTVFAAFAVAYAGYWVLGFGLFILAISPVPMAVGFWLRDRVVDTTRRVRSGPLTGGRP